MHDFLSFLMDVALRSSLILAAIFAVLAVMRRASASERHLVLLLGLVVVTLVPMIVMISPKIIVPVSFPWPAQAGKIVQITAATQVDQVQNVSPEASSTNVPSQAPIETIITPVGILIVMLAMGMVAQVFLLGRAAWAWRNIHRNAIQAHLPDEALERARTFAGTKGVPSILISKRVTVPLLAGWWQSVIILPIEARDWPVDRLTMVLCHEIAHYRRGDSLVLPLSAWLRVIYWWHPLVWLALVQLRRERESACDDLVLNQNIRASEYAELIVTTARQARIDSAWSAAALAMATSSSLSSRISSILDPSVRRRSASRAMIITGTFFALSLGWFFAAARVQAEDASAAPNQLEASASKTQVMIETKLVEIDEKVYQAQSAVIDEAVKKGDILFLVNLRRAWAVDAPTVTVETGRRQSAEISMERDLIQGNKSTPQTTLTIHPVVGPNGTIVKNITSDATTGPSKTPLGMDFKVVPSLSDDGAIILPFQYAIHEVAQYKDSSDYGIEAYITKENLKAIDGKAYAYWIGQKHAYSLHDIFSAPGDELTSLPSLSPSPNRLVLIVTARRVEK